MRILVLALLLTIATQGTAENNIVQLQCNKQNEPPVPLAYSISDHSGWLDFSQTEFNRIIADLTLRGMVYCNYIPVIEQINYDPVWCPGRPLRAPCKPWDRSIHRACLLAELKKIKGLSVSASKTAESLVSKQCAKIAKDPSWLDKLRYGF